MKASTLSPNQSAAKGYDDGARFAPQLAEITEVKNLPHGAGTVSGNRGLITSWRIQ